jgi:hypothetical protein
MKKHLLSLLISFVAVCFVSCKDDDADAAEGIVGKWEAVSFERSDCSDAGDNEIFQCSATQGTGICFTIEFRSDKTFKLVRTQGGDLMGEGAYVLNGPGLTFNYTISNPYNRTSPEFHMISISGNTMTATAEDGDFGCDTKAVYKKN